jgi:hypothetical protein
MAERRDQRGDKMNTTTAKSSLVSWGLTVVTVSEPQTWTILGGGLAAGWLLIRRRK